MGPIEGDDARFGVENRIERKLRAIFGDEGYEGLTDGERGAAERVLCAITGIKDTVVYKRWSERVVKAIWSAAYKVYGDGADVLRSTSRLREHVEYRSIMLSILHSMTAIPKKYLAPALGFSLTHSTVIMALRHAEDWRKVDKDFKARYANIEKLAVEELEE